jgi:hypothetical protein
MKIRPIGAKLFQADTLTDTTKQTVAFRNLAGAPNNDLKGVCLVFAVVKWLNNPYGGFSEYCNETYTENFPVAVIPPVRNLTYSNETH